jgi:hypothetical protein
VTATAEFAEVNSPEVKALGQDMTAKQKAELKTMRQILARLDVAGGHGVVAGSSSAIRAGSSRPSSAART